MSIETSAFLIDNLKQITLVIGYLDVEKVAFVFQVCPPLISCMILEEVIPLSHSLFICKMGVIILISLGYFEV